MCWTILRMGKTTFQNKQVFGNIRKCSTHTNLLCHNYLLFSNNSEHDMRLKRSIYEVIQILGISLTDKTYLRDLFDKSNFKNVKERYDSSEPKLFNF